MIQGMMAGGRWAVWVSIVLLAMLMCAGVATVLFGTGMWQAVGGLVCLVAGRLVYGLFMGETYFGTDHLRQATWLDPAREEDDSERRWGPGLDSKRWR